MPFKIQILGAVHIKVISQHGEILEHSKDSPPDRNKQGRTFQDSNVGAVHIEYISHNGEIQVPS